MESARWMRGFGASQTASAEDMPEENNENSPCYENFGMDVRRSLVLRPSPRIPLQDITYLFPPKDVRSAYKVELPRNYRALERNPRRRPVIAPSLLSRKRASQQEAGTSKSDKQKPSLRMMR